MRSLVVGFFILLSQAALADPSYLVCGGLTLAYGDWQFNRMSCFDVTHGNFYSAELKQELSSDSLGGSLDGGILYMPSGVPKKKLNLKTTAYFREGDDDVVDQLIDWVNDIKLGLHEDVLPSWAKKIVKRLKFVPTVMGLIARSTRAYWVGIGAGAILADEMGDVSIEFDGTESSWWDLFEGEEEIEDDLLQENLAHQ